MEEIRKQEELIYSVKDVFSSLSDKQFDIPDYQRGYKWTKDNIVELLEDIWSFNDDENVESFYCLQNITIIEKKKGEELVLSVIDGQQRLTTLFILLCYLGETALVKDKLSYSIRVGTGKFINDDVLSRKCFEDGYSHEASHQDEYYIQKGAETIKDWFEKSKRMTNEQKNSFKDKLLNHTKLIVNDVKGDEYQTFSNLNGARVPLDAADLIRAMLITYTVKNWKGNSSPESYRVRMGAEIDEMGIFWADEEVKKFFRQFIPDNLIKQDSENLFSKC